MSQHLTRHPFFDSSALTCFHRSFADELVSAFRLLNDTKSTPQSSNVIVHNQMTCSQLAFRLLSRKHPQRIQEWAHYTCNYRWYKELTIDKRPEVPILVIRTENLWQDATNIEIALGGNESSFVNPGDAMSHGSENYAVTAKLETDLQRHALCCAMYDDLQAYQDIILGAINLSSDEKEKMLELLYKDCRVKIDGMMKRTLDAEFWEDWYRVNCNALDWIR